ncbi:aldose epimerase family protein [Streptococcus entericus]|uniref:aldose epimerase family protein n=1 Tax=Streptococcus entericus TaxID=155680 RepID=UPI000365905C|nr:aldose epimerase family protein [Streptococcus entericus]
MAVSTRLIETIDGQEIHQITLSNRRGTRADFLTLGATWQSFYFPQPDGRLTNLVLGHELPSDYLKNGICAGQTVGRVAGRIKAGQAIVNGELCHLPANNNGNTLHGGPCGLHRQVWDYEVIEEEGKSGVRFSYRALAALDGFPGDMTITATYVLDDHDRLTVTYEGSEATSDTLFNPTNHVYFNLGEQDNLARHTLFIAANARLETDEHLIPTGRRLDVTGTPYDFRKSTSVIEAISLTGGLDDAFEVLVPETNPIAILTDQMSGNQVTVYSERNGLVVYSFNFPEEGVVFSRSNGRENLKHEGIALEAQTLPDAVNHADFGDIILKAGQTARYTITYDFDRID